VRHRASQLSARAARPKFSEYSIQLREKQKLRRIYGILEGQFRRYFQMADRAKGVTGETLLQLLERRMDNMVYRMGFATSRSEARQLVRHGHFSVNGRKVNVPSFLVKVGDVVAVTERSRKVVRIQEALDLAQRRGVPDWLEVSSEAFTGRVKSIPVRADLTMPINEKLVVELYSK
jgi:small subunit ribosomal protein S4